MPTSNVPKAPAASCVTPEDREVIRAWFASPEAGAALLAAAQEARATVERMRRESRIDWRELHRPIGPILP